MGTRNLTAVVLNGRFVLAQYGQWDGHPSGQGATALAFCRKHLKTAKGRSAFQKALTHVRFTKDGEVKLLGEQVGAKDGWLTAEQSREFNKLAPYLSRDHGAKILELVWGATGEVMVTDSSSFAADSLFCEYAYVIDLDQRTFEAYKGFQKEPLTGKDRFVNMKRDDDKKSEYYPVRMVGSWSLDELPTQRALEKAFGTDDDEE